MNDCLPMLQDGIAAGDQKAFGQLYEYFHARLIEFASSLVRSKETAEEIVEDVFVRLWSNRSKINEIENIAVYLYVSVKNRSLNSLSRKAKDLLTAPFDFLDIQINAQIPDPHELMISREMIERMRTAVNALPPRCKMIFKLIREDGLKYKEVAQILNISVNTIDAQMAIAVKRICQSLELPAKQSTLRVVYHKKPA